jgi:hypothetical protein
VCGRIGHTHRVCPDVEGELGDARFSPGLSASPTRRSDINEIKIPACSLSAKRALNFCGAQKDRVLSGNSNRDSLRPIVKNTGLDVGNNSADPIGANKNVSSERANVNDSELTSMMVTQDVEEILQQGVNDMRVQQHNGNQGHQSGCTGGEGNVSMCLEYDMSMPSLQGVNVDNDRDAAMAKNSAKSAREEKDDHVSQVVVKKISKLELRPEMKPVTLVGAHGEPHQEQ